MKKIYTFLLSLLLITYFSGCTKEAIIATDYYGETAIHSDDYARFTAEMDAVAYDVNAALEMTPGFSGKASVVLASICDAIVDVDTVSNPRTITIAYNGNTCLTNRKRTGKVIISMNANTRWKDPGAIVTVTLVNLTSTRLKDMKDMQFNNALTFTNVNGGLISDLSSLPNVAHTLYSDNIDVTFDNGKEWSWKMSRKKVYRQQNGITVTTTGYQTAGDIDGIGIWGNNRFGHPFLTPILIPLVSRQDCNYRVVSGKIELILTGKLYATAKLGLNESGSPISCPGVNNYWLEVIWIGPTGDRRILRHPYE